MDGLGVGKDYEGNAVLRAKTPHLDRLWTRAEYTALLGASGEHVGLPPRITGNSEVGHINIGAASIVPQMIARIEDSIVSGEFYRNRVLNEALAEAKRRGKYIHIIGLLSPAGVHSYIKHLYAILKVVKRYKLIPVLHLITDGRDTPRRKAMFYFDALTKFAKDLKLGFKVGSVSGRFWAMDRNNKWKRIKRAYDAMIGKSSIVAASFKEAVENAYKRQEDDEMLLPTTIKGPNDLYIKPKDVVIFFNFREDRARQLTKAFTLDSNSFNFFERDVIVNYFVTMSGYEKGLPVKILFEPKNIEVTVSDLISKAGLKQFHIAETEKYAHVTYFFNGGREDPTKGEDFVIIPSPDVFDYAVVPEMSAEKVFRELLARIFLWQYDFYLVNFANPDMIGHTGNLEAGIKAVELVDKLVGRLVVEFTKRGGHVLITADHGNIEYMINQVYNKPDKAHTFNYVPFIYTKNPKIFDDSLCETKMLRRLVLDPDNYIIHGVLADVGATVLKLLDIAKDPSMVGKSLI